MRVIRSPMRFTSGLNKSFITPLQPEEISHLAGRLDDILDYIDASTRKMFNYEIPAVDSYMVELAKLIQISAVEIEEAVKGIRWIKDPMVIERRCIEVNRLENLADDVLAHATKDSSKRKLRWISSGTRIFTSTWRSRPINVRMWPISYRTSRSGIHEFGEPLVSTWVIWEQTRLTGVCNGC